MIFNMVGSGGGGIAKIFATYPSGSTCTCTQGGTVLYAPNTSGMVVFSLPVTGNWTVKCQTAGLEDSAVVSAAANGVYEVNLDYGVLFANTDSIDSKWRKGNIALTFEDPGVIVDPVMTQTSAGYLSCHMQHWGWPTCSCIISNTIDAAHFNKLTFNVDLTQVIWNVGFCVWNQCPWDDTAKLVSTGRLVTKELNTEGSSELSRNTTVVELSLAGITDETYNYYAGFWMETGSTSATTAIIQRVFMTR